jgi:hypothetical protein
MILLQLHEHLVLLIDMVATSIAQHCGRIATTTAATTTTTTTTTTIITITSTTTTSIASSSYRLRHTTQCI